MLVSYSIRLFLSYSFSSISLCLFFLSDTQHPSIEELWMTKSSLDTLESLEPLRELPALVCVYLEHSPIAKVCVLLYYVTLCCLMLYYVVICHVMSCHVMLCYAILRYRVHIT